SPVAVGAYLDSSWRWAINFSFYLFFLFLYYFFFTYGPIGRLIQPIDGVDHSLASALFLGLLQAGIAALLLERRFRRSASLIDSWLAAAAVAIAFGAGLEADGRVLLLTGLLGASLEVESEPRWRVVRSAQLGALAGVLPFVKFQLGIGAWLVAAGLALLARIQRRPGASPVPFLLAAAATATALAAASFPDVRALARWGALSYELAVGFDAGMSTPARQLDLILVALIAGVVLALLWLARRVRDSDLAGAAVPVVLVLLLVYKHSFVRAFHRPPLFFLFALAALGCLLVWVRPGALRVAARGALGVGWLALAASLALHQGGLAGAMNRLSPARLLAAVLDAADPAAAGRARRERTEASRTELARLALPADWISRLGEPGATVTVLPWRLSVCAANPIPCVPPRTLQLYTAYTPALDRFVAVGFRTAPPRFLILHFPEAQRRLFFASTPDSWRALFGRYRLVAIAPHPALALLERIGPNSEQPLAAPESPQAAPLAYLSLELGQGPIRALARLAFQVPAVEVELDFESDRSATGRIVPANAAAGIALAAPADVGEAARILESGRARQVARVRLAGPGAAWYRIASAGVATTNDGPSPAIEIARPFD
ncbi:MAG: hypothetical protein K8H90_05390, partial [Thermoanaerobaculia bacterium]|nr:hypothetical protein [Thermoanaerobaculia bacterium]